MKGFFQIRLVVFCFLVLGASPWSMAGEDNSPSTENFDCLRRPGSPVSRGDSAVPLFSPPGPKSAQNPLYSPTGKKLAFTLFHKGYNKGPAGVYCLSLNDKSVLPVFMERDQDSVNLPGSAWNLKTNRIVFASDRLYRDEIWIISSSSSFLPNHGKVGEPPAGNLYHGVFPGGKTGEEDDLTLDGLKSYETAAGKTAAWVYFSQNWFRNRHFPGETASWIRRTGSIPYIRLMLRGDSTQNHADPAFALSKIINGDFDADLRTWAKSAGDFGTPIVVEYGTEMNGRWFPWNGVWNGGSRLTGYGDAGKADGPERFKDAYRRIIRLSREEGASNITWVFHVNHDDQPNEAWNRFEEYYPGDEWIDWLGVSIYGAQKPSDRYWEEFPPLMDKVYPRLRALAPSKPIALLEFGVTSGNPLGDQAAWGDEALSAIAGNRWPRLIGFSWWNETWENDDTPANDTNMRIQDNPALTASFRRWVGQNGNILGKAIISTSRSGLKGGYGASNWLSIRNFAYQLQDIDLTSLGNSRFDLIIMDYSSDGTESGRYSKKQIESLKNSAGGSKMVLAYMSIGEAETYRWYWRKNWDANNDGTPDFRAPAWLGSQNKEWVGNYKVKYWSPQWQSIVFRYIDKVIDAGFDGVYMDIIDAYEYWGPDGESGLNRATAGQEMVDFVKAIATYGRVTKGKPNFGIFPQNGEGLAANGDFVQTVNGIGKEDLWYNGNLIQSTEYTREAIKNLDVFKKAGKLVLTIEYPTENEKINSVFKNAAERGYVPYVTVRSLNALTIYPGHERD